MGCQCLWHLKTPFQQPYRTTGIAVNQILLMLWDTHKRTTLLNLGRWKKSQVTPKALQHLKLWTGLQSNLTNVTMPNFVTSDFKPSIPFISNFIHLTHVMVLIKRPEIPHLQRQMFQFHHLRCTQQFRRCPALSIVVWDGSFSLAKAGNKEAFHIQLVWP